MQWNRGSSFLNAWNEKNALSCQNMISEAERPAMSSPYSYRSASMGSHSAALRAGEMPKTSPMPTEKLKESRIGATVITV